MKYNITTDNYRNIIETTIFIFASIYLIIDSITGYLLNSGFEIVIVSKVYKTILLMMIICWALFFARNILLILLCSPLFLFLGPIYRMLAGESLQMELELLGLSVKILLPFYLILFCYGVSRKNKEKVNRWIIRTLFISSIIVALNLVIGLAGYGFSTYGKNLDTVIGVKGFFYAGNELSGLYIIICGFLLGYVWHRYSIKLYLLAAIITSLGGFIITTKVSMLGSIIVAFLIPIIYERQKLFTITSRKILISLLLSILILFAVVKFWDILDGTNLAHRISYIFEHQGFLGVIFSGRDEVAASMVNYLYCYGSLADLLLGVGKEKLFYSVGEVSCEIDYLDIYLWFGVPGLLFVITMLFIILNVSFIAFAKIDYFWGPSILLINIFLIILSALSGHILVSGTLGIVWGLFVSLSFISNKSLERLTLCKQNYG